MHILFKFSEISFVWHLLKNTRQIMITGIIIAYILSYFIKLYCLRMTLLTSL